MDKIDLCFTPATELLGAIHAKELSAVEITSTVLNRIAALEPKLNAFAHLAAEEAMDVAALADNALAKGASLGPLHGVPVTINRWPSAKTIEDLKRRVAASAAASGPVVE